MSDTSFPISRLSRIKEIGTQVDSIPTMRVYGMSPEASVVQLRVLGPITESGKGTPRNMIASAVLSEEDISRLIDLLAQERLRMGDRRARREDAELRRRTADNVSMLGSP